MARGPICNHCDEKLAPKQIFCGKCGHPTEHASHDERVLWDLGQWEVSRRRTASVSPSPDSKAKRAQESAARTKELFRSAKDKAATAAEARQSAEEAAPSATPEQPRRFMSGRIQREAPAARPAAPPAARPAAGNGTPSSSPASSPAPQSRRPAARSSAPPPSTPRPNQPSNGATTGRRAPTIAPERPSPARNTQPQRSAAPSPPKRPSVEAPLVMIRKPAAEAEGPPATAAPAAEASVAAPARPVKPSRAERKAGEEQRREAERVRRQELKEAERLRAEQKKQDDIRRAAQKAEEERRRTEEAKGARKRERKHKRHSKRVNRRTAELDLREGERVSLSIEGWSRFRRATLIVTNYRVALITRLPAQVRWIPLEEVEDVHHRWRGAHSLVVTSPIEVLTLQKSKREMLGSLEQLLEAEVAEARRPGATERHHADITQEWCDRSTEIWDSQSGRVRLWIRLHPAFAFASIVVFAVAAYLVASIFSYR